MTDIEIAKRNLDGHSICLCKNGEFFTYDGRGISPMMRFIGQGLDLSGYSAADLIVGKAAAMLFVKAKIASVYGAVMSKSAAEFLEKNNIPFSYRELTGRIINRRGDGICPMEQIVESIDDCDIAYNALREKLNSMNNTNLH